MQTFSISGGNSFVGQHLIELLLQDTSLKLRLLSHSTLLPSEHVQHLKGDLLSPETLNDFVVKADVVINLAYIRGGTIEDNVAAVKNLYDVSVNQGVKRFIHCSTAVVVGRSKETEINESTPCFPVNNYEKSKYAVEQMLLSQKNADCEVIIIRPTAVFGLYGKNVHKMINDICYGNKFVNFLKYYTYGYRKLNLVPVENVVNAFAFLANYKQKLNNEVFIISSDDSKNNNYRYLADSVLRRVGKSNYQPSNKTLPSAIIKFILLSSGRSTIEPMTTYSSEKLHNLGYVSPRSFEMALDKFIDCQLSGSGI